MEYKLWTKDEIKEMLEKDDKAVEKGVLTIFYFQTKDEREKESATRSNGVGFNRIDSEIMSSFAKRLQEGKSLTVKQMEIARKKILKYAGQLVKVANEKAEKEIAKQKAKAEAEKPVQIKFF